MDNHVDLRLAHTQHTGLITVKLYVRYGDACRLEVSKAPLTGSDLLQFQFFEMTDGLWNAMEKASLETFQPPYGKEIRTFNYRKMKEFYLRYALASWNLNKVLTRRADGSLDDDSYELVMSLHPAILRELASRVFLYATTKEEDDEIEVQCHRLFAQNSAVQNPNEYISLYCTLTGMWKNFGLNYFDLMNLPVKTRNALKRIVTIENNLMAQKFHQMELQTKSKATHTRGRR